MDIKETLGKPRELNYSEVFKVPVFVPSDEMMRSRGVGEYDPLVKYPYGSCIMVDNVRTPVGYDYPVGSVEESKGKIEYKVDGKVVGYYIWLDTPEYKDNGYPYASYAECVRRDLFLLNIDKIRLLPN